MTIGSAESCLLVSAGKNYAVFQRFIIIGLFSAASRFFISRFSFIVLMENCTKGEKKLQNTF